MALFYPDRLQSNNPAAFAIVRAAETAGHRQVADLAALYAVADCMLSDSGTNQGNDALGQLFYVQSESAFYQLTSWAGRRQASGWKRMDFATLGADGKLPLAQLPDLDTTLYKVVTALPAQGIEDNKIYLVANPAGESGNTYTEYARIDGQWEKLGEHQAETDLSGYVRFTDTATTEKAGAMSAADKKKLNKITDMGLNQLDTLPNDLISDLKAVDADIDSVTIEFEQNHYGSSDGYQPETLEVVLPAATAEKAGVMTAADKGLLGQLRSIVGGISITGTNYLDGKHLVNAVATLDGLLKSANDTIQQLQAKVTALEAALTLKQEQA